MGSCSASGHKGPGGWPPCAREFSLAGDSPERDLQHARDGSKLFVALFLLKIRWNYMNHPPIILPKTVISVFPYLVQTCNSAEFETLCWTREEDAGEAYHYIRFRPLTPASWSDLLGALWEGGEAQLSKLGT